MLESLFETCGYLATFLGTLLEGELSLITSVLGAKMGYFNFYVAMGAAFAGAWLADWFKFIVGKTKGKKVLESKPKLQSKFNKVTLWFDKHPFLLLTFYKFFFGFTTIILLVSGLRDISYARFALHSGISVLLWTIILGGLAFHCAEALNRNIEFVSTHKLEVLGVLSVIIFFYWLLIKRPYRKACLDYGDD